MSNSQAIAQDASATLMRAWEARALAVVQELLRLLNEVRTGGTKTRSGAEPEASGDALHRALVTLVMRAAVTLHACQRGLPVGRGRLFEESQLAGLPRGGSDRGAALRRELEDLAVDGLGWIDAGNEQQALPCDELPIESIGGLYERLIQTHLVRDGEVWSLEGDRSRKRSGSFYTPRAITQMVVERALETAWKSKEPAPARGRRDQILALRVCDPAMGAGAFLLEACRQLAGALQGAPGSERPSEELSSARRLVAEHCLYGVDVNPLAVAVAEASLWLLIGDPALPLDQAAPNLMHGDSLTGPGPEGSHQLELGRPALCETEFDWPRSFPDVWREGAGFDVIVGNPPWVAYAGRATQPLAPERREYFSRTYQAWRGYPTLHALFIERSAALAPRGVVALLLPSPVADLDGYRNARASLTARHVVCEPLVEFGQDAFESVTQPCFALIAAPSDTARSSSDRWPLTERQRVAAVAAGVHVPEVLRCLAEAPPFPDELFGEMGFQSNRVVTQSLLLRADAPDGHHRYPLLEGRNVREFEEGPVRLFLNADPQALRRAGVRLRNAHDYARVRFVVRQTASIPIAALHGGLPFRNSLLAGFDHAAFPPELAVGLLNSALYRALHLARQRDARQAAFPQVKIRHLRSLPRPPPSLHLYRRVEALTRVATEEGVSPALRRNLDDAVFELFVIPAEHRGCVADFLARRLPGLGYEPTGAADSDPNTSLAQMRERLLTTRER